MEEHEARCAVWEAKLAEREAKRATKTVAALTQSTPEVGHVFMPPVGRGLAIELDDPYHSLVAQVQELEEQRLQDHFSLTSPS